MGTKPHHLNNMEKLMKKILFALTLLVATNMAFASIPTGDQIPGLAQQTIAKLNEKEENLRGPWYCDEYEGRIECVWEIEGTGRTSDTMHGIFIEKDGEFILVDAFEEYGC